MQVDLKKLKPLGIVLVLGFAILVFIMCLTADMGIPERYEPAHDASYYTQNGDTLRELAEEAEKNVLPAFQGRVTCQADPEAGVVRVTAEKKLVDKVRAVLDRDFGKGLFTVTAEE